MKSRLSARQSAGHLFLVAESSLNDPRLVRPREAGGYGLDAQWSDDFHHALHALLTDEHDGYYMDFSGRMADLAYALEHVFVYDGRYSPHRDRVVGRPVGDLSAHRFLGFLQNHDHIGNRAQGERSSTLLSPGLLKVAAALVLTAPFTPLLFQGEEWGASTPFQYFTDHHDPELGRAISEGRRAEFVGFGWRPEDVPDPQDPATAARSTLDWEEATQEPHAAHAGLAPRAHPLAPGLARAHRRPARPGPRALRRGGSLARAGARTDHHRLQLRAGPAADTPGRGGAAHPAGIQRRHSVDRARDRLAGRVRGDRGPFRRQGDRRDNQPGLGWAASTTGSLRQNVLPLDPSGFELHVAVHCLGEAAGIDRVTIG